MRTIPNKVWEMGPSEAGRRSGMARRKKKQIQEENINEFFATVPIGEIYRAILLRMLEEHNARFGAE